MVNQRHRSFLTLTLLSLLIALIGLLAVYNASVVEAHNTFSDKYYFAKQQLIWLSFGFGLYLIISFFPPQLFKTIAPAFLVLALLAMLLVLIPGLGVRLQGARRWLNLGFIRFQPSELLKVGLLIYLASWLENRQELSKFLFLIGICLGLIMLQPDLGTAIIISSIGFGLYFVSGAALKQVTAVVFIIAAAVLLLTFGSSYRLERLKTFLDPSSDPLGRSYHINQILLGLGSGGSFGVGLGRSRQKYAYLPEATTDSIFTIVGEELGFAGAVILITLLISLSLLAFRIAQGAPTQHTRLLATGVALLVSAQTLVNLSSMVALVPLTGVPLTLISYGGSALIATFMALGILASIARHK